jgi:hypothetical protein
MRAGIVNIASGFLIGILVSFVSFLIYTNIKLSDENKWLESQNKGFYFYVGRMEGVKMDYKTCLSLVGRMTREYYLEGKKNENKNFQTSQFKGKSAGSENKG